jgi:beta-lactam-binding protein with PASTA domain
MRSRTFLFHILAAIGFYLLCIFLFAFFVRLYTKHGEAIMVPDLRGKTYDEVVRVLSENDLEYAIADSTYDESKPALSVIDQNPKPDTRVKEYRTIYLTVNSRSAPSIKMPDLKDASLKQATDDP